MSTFQTISKLIVGLTHRILIAPDTGGLEGYTQVSDLLNVIANNHDHDSDYAALTHNHDSDYAALTHNHDSDYAALTHNHEEFLTQAEIEALPGFGGGEAALPVGVVMLWLYGPAPVGWYLLNGITTVSEVSELGIYLINAGLVASEGVVTLPDISERFPLCVSGTYPEMSMGGSLLHTLTPNQMPAHGGHASGSKWVQGSNNTEVGVKATISYGGGLPFPVLPAYFSTHFIIYGGG